MKLMVLNYENQFNLICLQIDLNIWTCAPTYWLVHIFISLRSFHQKGEKASRPKSQSWFLNANLQRKEPRLLGEIANSRAGIQITPTVLERMISLKKKKKKMRVC